MKLTNDDVSMVCYFIEEYDDVTRWCDWDAKKHLIEQKYPELTNALRDSYAADKALKRIVKSISDELDDF